MVESKNYCNLIFDEISLIKNQNNVVISGKLVKILGGKLALELE